MHSFETVSFEGGGVVSKQARINAGATTSDRHLLTDLIIAAIGLGVVARPTGMEQLLARAASRRHNAAEDRGGASLVSGALTSVRATRSLSEGWRSKQVREALLDALALGLAEWPDGDARLTAQGARYFMKLRLAPVERRAVRELFGCA